MTVENLTDDTFRNTIGEADLPVLVDYYAPWCGPCRMVGPVVEEIAEDNQDKLQVFKMNTDDNQRTAVDFQIFSIPTLILFKGGQEVKRIVGAYPKVSLLAELEPFI